MTNLRQVSLYLTRGHMQQLLFSHEYYILDFCVIISEQGVFQDNIVENAIDF